MLFMNVSTMLQIKRLSHIEINGESDHVHILMEADTTTSPAELANVLKRKQPEEPESCMEKPF